MNKTQFIEGLGESHPTKEEKIEVCQYFIDEYPVNTAFSGYTKLNGITITGGTDKAIDFAYNQLKKHLSKFKIN